MTCRELVELVTDYFDGALDEHQRTRFEAHLTVCSGCVNHVEQLRLTLRLAGDLKALEQRPDVVALLDAFRAWQRP